MKCKIEFAMNNAAFEDSPATEAARILRAIANSIALGYEGGPCADINGNTVGVWAVSSESDGV